MKNLGSRHRGEDGRTHSARDIRSGELGDPFNIRNEEETGAEGVGNNAPNG